MHGCSLTLYTSSSLTAPSDYTAISNQLLEFVEGDSLKSIPVTIGNDTIFEDLELFQATINLISPVGLPPLPGNIPVISVVPSLAQVNITDDDGKDCALIKSSATKDRLWNCVEITECTN